MSAAVALAGLGVALYFWENSGWCVPGGARQFLIWADQIAGGGSLDPAIAQRDVGYPLLLALSGWPWTRSLQGIVAIQVAMAAIMPILAYTCILPFNRAVAVCVGVAAAFSLGPVFYMKMIHHDQAYVFWVLATGTALIAFIATNKGKYLYLFTGCCLAATLTRPAGVLLFPLLLAVAFWASRPRLIRHFVAVMLIFIAAIACYHEYRQHLFGDASYTGAQLFYNPYMNARDYHVRLDPSANPALARLDGDLAVALADPKFLADHVGAEPPEAAAALFDGVSPERIWAEPNWEYFMLLSDAEADDHVLLGAAVALMAAHPVMVARYTARNFLLFLFDPGWAHSRYNALPLNYGGLDFLPGVSAIADVERGVIGPLAVAEASALPHPFLFITPLWKAGYKLGVPAGMVLVLAGWVAVAWRRPSRAFVAAFAIVTALILYEAAITGLFAEPSYRYADFVITLRVLAAGFGVCAMWGIVL